MKKGLDFSFRGNKGEARRVSIILRAKKGGRRFRMTQNRESAPGMAKKKGKRKGRSTLPGESQAFFLFHFQGGGKREKTKPIRYVRTSSGRPAPSPPDIRISSSRSVIPKKKKRKKEKKQSSPCATKKG